MEERLALRWQTLLTQHFTQLSLAEIQQSWSRLLPHYRESHRHYHDLQHIDASFTWFDQVQDTLDNPLAVALAIWFHDIIYDVRRSDNEEKSAQYAVTALTKVAASTTLVQQVYELILLTQHPSKPSQRLETLVTSHDQALFLDIDLTILGQRDAIYANYEKAIRAEYQHVPLWLYKLGRKRLLKQFLAQPKIYYSDYFSEKFESQARVNIQSVLKS
jgi:predicted metal-dependent HD superfamily phosphohydrolase